jgi:predicted NAD/FAD-dependent oxidoreductase
MGQGGAVTGLANNVGGVPLGLGLTRRGWVQTGVGASLGLGMAALGTGCAPRDTTAHITGGFTGTDPARGHVVRDATYGAPTVTRRTRVLIAGGGIAGLAAARALRLRGIADFALIELDDSVGGNSRAGRIGGIACPMGAHYLPVPGDDASEVQDFLEELGLRKRVSGRWQYDERHLCHSPQERLFFRGEWQEGLLPLEGVGASTLAQYRRFAQLVDVAQRQVRFTIPAFKTPFRQIHAQLDAMTFGAWLAREGLDDPQLLWYLNYCCRDDYGAGVATVSAWAGLHYFASRHGFQAPGEGQGGGQDGGQASDHSGGVLTWPDGNATLTRALAADLGERVHTGCAVLRIAPGRHGVAVDVLRHATQTVERWMAEHCIVALPAFIAARVVTPAPAPLQELARHLRYAPWVVANVHIRAPLQDRPGAAPAWDNVVYDAGSAAHSGALGYVNARHQSLDPRPGPTVLTHYRALGDAPDLAAGRHKLLGTTWADWRDQTLASLAIAHPDIAAKTTHIDITRYGHAMAMPVPGTLTLLRKYGDFLMPFGNVYKKSLLSQKMGQSHSNLSFAHSDWSGYSIFEEAFTRGHWAGMAAVA